VVSVSLTHFTAFWLPSSYTLVSDKMFHQKKVKSAAALLFVVIEIIHVKDATVSIYRQM
jgi:hypothetical protein